ncbi:hypothetical protein [Paracoccus aminophilus]|uniref:Uncharacterized protein n=1 Tax=Paracoccus aminophilus JCM 7686 TaxID=1367847 RepID=S5Y2H0_PARAH|nr:hypothetical protein [Paracoccus aminophilus]AGT09945.1 hypothetical protein JCM7686_2889 [Paracoccus aminophilus JCM 7686]
MKWQQVQDNWAAFFEAIAEKWPEADESDLEEIDGDQRDFIKYIAEVTGQEVAEARDEIREWLSGEIPSDVVMDPSHDNRSMVLSSKYIGEGEDTYDDDRHFGDDGEYPDDGDLTPTG